MEDELKCPASSGPTRRWSRQSARLGFVSPRRLRLIARALAGHEEVLTYKVEAHLFAACALEGKSLLSSLEAGECQELDILMRTFGAAIEFVLCDLFSQNESASHYWVDGVIIDAVTLQPGRIVVAKGRAWCADRREQWQIPTEIICRFSSGQQPNLLSVLVRVGNAAMATLREHRDRSITKIGDPLGWLLEFEVSP